jgi:PPOX class probable F420-dependent enzyme
LTCRSYVIKVGSLACNAMTIRADPDTLKFIGEHRIARLGTVDAQGQPMVVPICYVFDGVRIYSPIDEKPKRVEAGQLKRVRNIEANPRVSLVIDDYSEDWTKLAFVIVSGVATMMSVSTHSEEHARAVELLRAKYTQYRSMRIDQRVMIGITPTRISMWKASQEHRVKTSK